MKRTMPRPSIDAYIDVQEAARLLGVSKQAVLQMIWTRKLPAHKFGQNYALLREHVETLKQQRAWDHIPEELEE